MPRRTKEFRIMVSEEEYARILKNAKKINMQTAPYIRAVAQSPTIVRFDYSVISEHTKAIGEIRTCINRLIFTIDATNNYLPKEIHTIVSLVEEIFKSENRLLKQTQTAHEKLRNELLGREP